MLHMEQGPWARDHENLRALETHAKAINIQYYMGSRLVQVRMDCVRRPQHIPTQFLYKCHFFDYIHNVWLRVYNVLS